MQMLAPADGPLIETLAEFCRRNAMAESTFGRCAVNDGKFVACYCARHGAHPPRRARCSCAWPLPMRWTIAHIQYLIYKARPLHGQMLILTIRRGFLSGRKE